jgi:hypothetical protein
VRFLRALSPLGEVRNAAPDRICATDFARLRELSPAAMFTYKITARAGGKQVALQPEVGAEGELCFRTHPIVEGTHPDGDAAQRVTIEITNGSKAAPLRIHAYDLGARGMHVVGLTRPEN